MPYSHEGKCNMPRGLTHLSTLQTALVHVWVVNHCRGEWL